MTLYAPGAVLNIVPPLPGLPGNYTGLKEIGGMNKKEGLSMLSKSWLPVYR